jgi:hypothetical protein
MVELSKGLGMAPIIVHVVEDNTVLYTVGGTLVGVFVGGVPREE